MVMVFPTLTATIPRRSLAIVLARCANSCLLRSLCNGHVIQVSANNFVTLM
jgi:hypothetical protein